MLKSTPKTVVIVDNDFLNPYGRLLAELLSPSIDVIYIGDKRASWVPHSVRCMWLLASLRSKPLSGLLTLLRYYIYLWYCTLVGRQIIIVWHKNAGDLAILGMAGALGRQATIVIHNPLPRHRTSSMTRRLWLFAVANNRAIVHSSNLVHGDALVARHLDVIPHLSYSDYVKKFVDRGQTLSKQYDFALIGALRADKGSTLLAELLTELSESMPMVRVVIAGRASPEALSEVLGSHLSRVALFVDEDGISDQTIIDVLRRSHVLLAPYTNATQSGTITLAHALNIPTVAFEVGALNELVNEHFLAPLGNVKCLVDKAVTVLETPTTKSYKQDSVKLCATVTGQWRDYVNSM